MNTLKSSGLLVTAIAFFISCKSIQHVEFATPVDTRSRPIQYQIKQTYALDKVGIYASNEFNCARLNGFRLLNDSTALVDINPENQPINHSAYYAFSIWSDTPTSFYFKFQYPKDHKHRYIPKIKRNNKWTVLDSTRIQYQDTIVTIRLDVDTSRLIVAAQELQSASQVKSWYSELTENKSTYVKLIEFGQSTLGRSLPVLDIGKGNSKNKDIVLLLTRQHPPEVTGYFAFQEFLQTILDESELSDEFLRKYRVLAFPIMNPDGVDLGHWRHNAGGVDLNRDWSIYNQLEIKQTVKFINKTAKRNDSKIVLGLDFHSTSHDIFYTNKARENTSIPSFIENWFTGLEENIPGYKVNEAPGNSSKPVSKGWLLYGHNAVGITYEIGDQTPKDKIKVVGKVSAQEMMKLLINHYQSKNK